jgi:hypothetical protein
MCSAAAFSPACPERSRRASFFLFSIRVLAIRCHRPVAVALFVAPASRRLFSVTLRARENPTFSPLPNAVGVPQVSPARKRGERLPQFASPPLAPFHPRNVVAPRSRSDLEGIAPTRTTKRLAAQLNLGARTWHALKLLPEGSLGGVLDGCATRR